MNLSISIPVKQIKKALDLLNKVPFVYYVVSVAFLLAYCATLYAFKHNIILAYGDAQSHINISKRIVDSITPGMAQLGGVWLPLSHLLMVPFVKSEFLYRTGLAGSIVSGIAFLISCVYIYKLALFLTKSRLASFISFLVFALNPNILYIQTTPLTEMTLITFFILSSYYFIRFMSAALINRNNLSQYAKDEENLNLILASFYGFCASLSRYDGWFLVMFEAMVVFFVYLPLDKYTSDLVNLKFSGIGRILKNKLYLDKLTFNRIQGMIILFCTLAFIGIGLWFAWDWLILGDPLYFSDSTYSAGSQQKAFQGRGQLPAAHNLPVAFEYYFFDSMTNLGVIIFAIALIGLGAYLLKTKKIFPLLTAGILVVPFIFNVLTLYLGQSIIYIPSITPANFEWHIFNVRYGILMMPAAAIFVGLLFYYAKTNIKLLLVFLIFVQVGLYVVGYSPVIILTDGTVGLSASKTTDADAWMKSNYDGGLIVMDDFARSLNIIADNLPMQKIIYIGNKPYYQDSMVAPEKYATWVVMQKNDDVWNHIWENPASQARLYKYFNKVYTSPDVLIFKRMPNK